jgi:hypothetical protein
MVVFVLLLAPFAALHAADTNEAILAQRRDAALATIQKNPSPDPEKRVDFKQHMALLLLFKNEKVDEANRLVLESCGASR